MADDIDAAIDRLHDAGATDEEITSIIREKFGKPFDVKAQNETMRANMAKQDVAASRAPESEFTLSKMAGRAGAGLKGEIEGAAGGLAGLAALPGAAYMAVRHPVATARGLGTTAMLAGRLVKQAYDNPSDTLSSAADAATKLASDPENIGMAAGGLDVALATPAMTRAIRGTRIGQAVGTGLSSAVDRVPGVKEARAAWTASAPADVVQPITPNAQGMSPIELIRSMKPKGEALEQAKAAAFAHAGPPPKLSFTSQEVLKIKMLIQQGIPQDKAIELVKAVAQ